MHSWLLIAAVKLANATEVDLARQAVDDTASVTIKSEDADSLWMACAACEQPWDEVHDTPCPGVPAIEQGNPN
jgi:hypothetical protein